MKTKTLVADAAGFIGFHRAMRLIEDGYPVIGIDALTEDYDPGLKRARYLDRFSEETGRPTRLNAGIEASNVRCNRGG